MVLIARRKHLSETVFTVTSEFLALIALTEGLCNDDDHVALASVHQINLHEFGRWMKLVFSAECTFVVVV